MIDKLRLKFINNNDAKILILNFASLSLLKLMGYLFPLITLPYLSRIIGPAGFGEIAFATAIMIYFETITDFGFNYTATRDIARNKNNIKEVSKIFSNVLYSKIILMLISALVLILCIEFIPFLKEKRLLLWLTFLYIPGHILFPDWFFQAQEKMVYITILNFISKLIFTFCVFFLIKEQKDYIYQPLLIALGYLTSGIISLCFIFSKFKVKLTPFSICEIKFCIKKSWNMFVSLFIPNLYSNFSIIILRIFCGNVAVGIFTNGDRFSSLSSQLSQVISRTFYPYLARRIDKHKLYVRISAIINISISIILFLSADYLVDIFYTHEFKDCAKIIRIMSLTPIALFMMHTYGTNYMVLQGYEKIYSKIVLLYSIIGFIVACLIIPIYSYIGIAITLTITRLIGGFIIMIYSLRIKSKEKVVNNAIQIQKIYEINNS